MLFLVYVIFPILEIYLLFKVGGLLGFWPVLGLVILTAWVGSALVKHQGLTVLYRFQQKVISGENPKREGLEGVLILFAGILLITPGFITDGIGILCLIPLTRYFITSFVLFAVEKRIKDGRFKVYAQNSRGPFHRTYTYTNRSRGTGSSSSSHDFSSSLEEQSRSIRDVNLPLKDQEDKV